jgi:hypothetical protein
MIRLRARRFAAAAGVCLGVASSSIAGARQTEPSSAAPAKTWVTQITRDVVKRVGAWSRVRPTVSGLWFYGPYAEVAYHTENGGGTAIYYHTASKWRLVCGGGGALDRAGAKSVCGLSAKDAAGLLRHKP